MISLQQSRNHPKFPGVVNSTRHPSAKGTHLVISYEAGNDLMYVLMHHLMNMLIYYDYNVLTRVWVYYLRYWPVGSPVVPTIISTEIWISMRDATSMV